MYPAFALQLLNAVECFVASVCLFLHAMGGLWTQIIETAVQFVCLSSATQIRFLGSKAFKRNACFLFLLFLAFFLVHLGCLVLLQLAATLVWILNCFGLGMSCFCICQLWLAAQKQSAKSSILHLYNQCGSLSSYSKADIHLYKTQGGTQKTYLPLAAQWSAVAPGWTQLLSKMSFPTHFCTCVLTLPQKELCDQRCQQSRKKGKYWGQHIKRVKFAKLF